MPRKLLLSALGIVLAASMSFYVVARPAVESGTTKPKNGVVLDAETKKPIVGAYVIVRWSHHVAHRLSIGHGGNAPGGGVARIVVQTDANGRFHIPSPGAEFQVSTVPSLELAHEYYWGLSVFSPGYFQPKFSTAEARDSHPPVKQDGNEQQLEPVEMIRTQDAADKHAYYLTTVVPQEFTCWQACGSLDFANVLYRTAYPLTCEQGGWSEVRALAELRFGHFGSMPAVSADITREIQEISKSYRFNEPLPEEDARRICALLKRADEAQP